jgi:predicted  nucleic acid-binding Zn-ribbon protein
VVVAALDRLGRRLIERVRSREELRDLGVETHSVRDGGYVNDFVSNILASVAEEESRRLGERVARTFGHITSQGWKKPGKALWGYRWRPATAEERAQGAPKSVLDADPETAPYVREMFERLAARESMRAVARWVRSLPEPARGGQNLAFRTLLANARNPTYVARAGGAGDPLEQPAQRWPALVADDLFRRARERLGDRVLRGQASDRFLLTGMIRCPECGGRMFGYTNKRHPNAPRYNCNGWALGAKGADCHVSVSGTQIDAIILAEVDAILAAVSGDETLREEVRRAWDALARVGDEPDQGARVAALRAEATRRRDLLARAAELFVGGDLDRDGYERLRERARAALDAAEAEIQRLQGQRRVPVLPPFDRVLAEVGGWSSALSHASVAERRKVLAQVVQRVVPHRRPGHYVLEVAWTPVGQALREAASSVVTLPLNAQVPPVAICVECGAPIDADPSVTRTARKPRKRCHTCHGEHQRRLKADSHQRRYASQREVKLARRYPCRSCGAEIGPRLTPSGRIGRPLLCHQCLRETRREQNRVTTERRRRKVSTRPCASCGAPLVSHQRAKRLVFPRLCGACLRLRRLDRQRKAARKRRAMAHNQDRPGH